MPGNRRSIRLKNHDYSQEGAYYVTVCSDNRECVFGGVHNHAMVLSDAGSMIDKWWRKLPDKYTMIEIDEYQVMPNHIHGIIHIGGTNESHNVHASRVTVGAPFMGALDDGPDVHRAGALDDGLTEERAPMKGAPTLGQIIGAFKSITTNEYIRGVKTRNWPTFNKRLWQRNYYEHVIRNESDLMYIREYIVNNPASWESDEYYSPLNGAHRFALSC